MLWVWMVFGTTGAAAVLAALMTLIGLRLAKTYTATRSLVSTRPPEAVWDVITDHGRQPFWRSHLTRIDRLPCNDRPQWREVFRTGYAVLREVSEAIPPRRLVWEWTDEAGSSQGRWLLEIVPTEAGSRISLTEYGTIGNPLLRSFQRLVVGRASSVEEYLRNLARRLGDPPLPT